MSKVKKSLTVIFNKILGTIHEDKKKELKLMMNETETREQEEANSSLPLLLHKAKVRYSVSQSGHMERHAAMCKISDLKNMMMMSHMIFTICTSSK